MVYKSQAEHHKEIGLKGALCSFQIQTFNIYNIKRKIYKIRQGLPHINRVKQDENLLPLKVSLFSH